jgi:hypothetical protein
MNPKKELKIDISEPIGMFYIVPVEISGIKGWNYSVRDYYKLAYKMVNEKEYEKIWLFKDRVKEYTYPQYFDKDKEEYVKCKCPECIEGQLENPDMDKKPEVLLTLKDL